jgi:hypothetical protein
MQLLGAPADLDDAFDFRCMQAVQLGPMAFDLVCNVGHHLTPVGAQFAPWPDSADAHRRSAGRARKPLGPRTPSVRSARRASAARALCSIHSGVWSICMRSAARRELNVDNFSSNAFKRESATQQPMDASEIAGPP